MGCSPSSQKPTTDGSTLEDKGGCGHEKPSTKSPRQRSKEDSMNQLNRRDSEKVNVSCNPMEGAGVNRTRSDKSTAQSMAASVDEHHDRADTKGTTTTERTVAAPNVPSMPNRTEYHNECANKSSLHTGAPSKELDTENSDDLEANSVSPERARARTAPVHTERKATAAEAEHTPITKDAWGEQESATDPAASAAAGHGKAEDTNYRSESERASSSSGSSSATDDTEHQIQVKEQRINELESNLAKLESSLAAAIKEKNIEVKKLEQEKVEQKEEIESLSNRLSKEMVWKVTSSDDTSLENVNVKTRPMTLADEFRMICSDAWLQANTNLEEQVPQFATDEDTKYKLLSRIMMIAEAGCKEAKAIVFDMLAQSIENPLLVFKECLASPKSKHKTPRKSKDKTLLDSTEDRGGLKLRKFKRPKNPGREISSSMNLEITNYLRLTIDRTETKYLEKFVLDKVVQAYPGLKKQEGVESYTKEVTLLCWKMIVQQPPMTFDTSHTGEPWSKKDHAKLEPYFGSDIKCPGARVLYYVFPSLVHGDQTMVQGKIMVGEGGDTHGQ